MGTVGYMSPEQVRGLARRSPLRHLLLRRGALRDADGAAGLSARNGGRDDDGDPEGGAARAGGRAARVPPALAPVLRHCLEKKPEKRFQSASDLAFALETAAARDGPRTPVSAVRRRASVLPWKRLGVAALVAGAAVAGYLLHPRRAAAPVPDWKDATLTPLTTDPGLRGRADVLSRRADDRLRRRPRRKLRDLPAADLGRTGDQPDPQPGRGHPAGFLSRRPRDRLRFEPLEHLGPHSRRARPSARRGRHLGDARPRGAGAPDRRERGLPVLDAGRIGPPLRARHLPQRADRAHSRGGRREP